MQSHSEVLGIRVLADEYWGNTVRPLTEGHRESSERQLSDLKLEGQTIHQVKDRQKDIAGRLNSSMSSEKIKAQNIENLQGDT